MATAVSNVPSLELEKVAYTQDQDQEPVPGDAPPQTSLQPTVFARIPQEIFDETIDWMARPTFLGAALVCTAWYPRAMHNLYFTVRISTHARFVLLAKLAHAYPRVRSWLATTRTLFMADMKFPDYKMGWRPNTGPILHAVPLVFGRMMSGLQSLDIEGAVHPHMLPKFALALSQFKTVKSLRLRVTTPNTVSQILWIISSFPQLTDLDLHSDTFVAIPESSGNTRLSHFEPRCDIRLRRLRIQTDGFEVQPSLTGAFVGWLVRSDICTSLDDLTVCWENSTSLPMMVGCTNRILRAAGPSLTRYLEEAVDTDSEQHANLVHNTSLRSIGFGLGLIEDAKPTHRWSRLVDNLTSILSTVRSCQLEHISMAFLFKITDDGLRVDGFRKVLENLNLMGVHDIMRRSYFERLKDVEMTIMTGHRSRLHYVSEADVRQELLATFRALLKPWCDRNIVRIDLSRRW
ncbi:uncharacterized protein B0H18DRAFT_988303 [Fomitopsis serialis]|uniref:uncharacterized protein n=1 Tax=Fomitopsis serialis TaxID=139415 RepID=UPI0020083CDD|nr:uncharacterized protein B0H18DRAFT_988303 [Neoantrodia serialis]KAH9931865.1 hypothetical protein B0H18DRAFT_988303 [Neoantrodia serialis]